MISKKVLIFLVCLNICYVINVKISSAFEKPEVFVQLGHSYGINFISFSPDGKYIVSASDDKSIRLWDVVTGRELMVFHDTKSVKLAIFSPDNLKILSGNDEGNIKLWDIGTGEMITNFETNSKYPITSLSFSPDGKTFIATQGYYLFCWDVETKKNIWSIKKELYRISSADFLPDGKSIALGVNIDKDTLFKLKASKIEIYEIETKKIIKSIPLIEIKDGYENYSSEEITNIKVSSSGKYALVSIDKRGKNGKVYIVDLQTSSIIKIIPSSNKEINYNILTFSSNDKFAGLSRLGEILIIDIPELTVLKRIDDKNIWQGVAFSPDNQMIVYATHGNRDSYGEFQENENIELIDLTTWRKIKNFSSNGINQRYPIKRNGKLISLTGWRYLIWDVAKAELLKTNFLHGIIGEYLDIYYLSDDGKYILAADKNEVLHVYDIDRNKLLRLSGVQQVFFNSKYKEQLILLTDNWEFLLWDIVKNKKIKKIADWSNKKDITEQNIKRIFLTQNLEYLLIEWNDDKKDYLVHTISIYDLKTKTKMSEFDVSIFSNVITTPEGKLVIYDDYDAESESYYIIFRNIRNGQIVKKIKVYDMITSFSVSQDGKRLLSGIGNSIVLWDIERGEKIKTFLGHQGTIGYLGFSDYNKYIVSSSPDGTTRLWDIATGKEIAQFIAFTDGEWIVITPEGYYNASPNGEKHLNVRIGNNVYGIENYREAFYRPDLVKLALAGKSLHGYRTLADAGTPPVVEIIDTPSKTDKDEIKVTLKLTDTGSGIGDIKLYLNDTAVLVDSTRGIKVTPKAGEKSIFKTYTVKLLNGENIIKAVAFNGDNTMQSNPAVQKVIASISIKKPSMYAVVIGINEYKNPKLTLKYAVADAKLFAETISQIAKPLFEKVEVNLLTTKEETTKENIKKILEGYKNLNPEDVFVFYVASHGTVDEGEYFLITSNVGSLSTFRLKEDALTQAELKELIANVPSTKKFIVIDTCNAGKLGEALQMAMLTRGMSEETAVKILSKAVGSTIISASTSLQEALEGYQGHGLFTYALVEGLKGKADTDRDGFIKTLELASYVDSEVPSLAEKIFKKAQYPTATPTGQSFPVGKVR
ncbi:caspase family protein [Calditerrivibrio nitroreducens]|uniref:WD40 repeat, subgroup n=1 Tax=Calditerrivibrio nitroreducens (strain DSM 19672 / NBRC 101217 / Yu37-1) TaxID=768670 RepID=E4TH68_CALNY|nr:caspase family protein [Calditerrivibrio nitroreducens]ADR18762.1 WD40 repeat, subgroup [Calditerrivibrio nitroreducens DSM 19672]